MLYLVLYRQCVATWLSSYTPPLVCLSRQVIIVLTQLEGSGGFSIAHRLTHRLAFGSGLNDWGTGGGDASSHVPALDAALDGLHAARPLWGPRVRPVNRLGVGLPVNPSDISVTVTGWGGHLFRTIFWEYPWPLGFTAAAMLPKKARGTLRKHITKPSEQVAAPPST